MKVGDFMYHNDSEMADLYTNYSQTYNVIDELNRIGQIKVCEAEDLVINECYKLNNVNGLLTYVKNSVDTSTIIDFFEDAKKQILYIADAMLENVMAIESYEQEKISAREALVTSVCKALGGRNR